MRKYMERRVPYSRLERRRATDRAATDLLREQWLAIKITNAEVTS